MIKEFQTILISSYPWKCSVNSAISIKKITAISDVEAWNKFAYTLFKEADLTAQTQEKNETRLIVYEICAEEGEAFWIKSVDVWVLTPRMQFLKTFSYKKRKIVEAQSWKATSAKKQEKWKCWRTTLSVEEQTAVGTQSCVENVCVA
jgi:hypothetical protein